MRDAKQFLYLHLSERVAGSKMGDTATIAAARAKYSKQDGFLYLTDAPHRVIWVNASTKLPELLLAADDITS
jgi:hypothetical protein